MKIALVHDYIKEYGGAERVLEALCEIYPDAPIYTAFYKKDSLAFEKFKDKDVRVSFAHYIPFFADKLHSPLRFLAPLIWGSFIRQLADYDVVISSASWYITKGFGSRGDTFGFPIKSGMTEIASSPSANAQDSRNDERRKMPIEICYCHTPPRWLYGYKTSVEWQRFWLVKIYGMIVGHFMRQYDFNAAQKVDYFIANSEEVKARIKKFYRREAKVIYPPVEIPKQVRDDKDEKRRDYYFIVSRIVGSKGLELAIEAAVKMGFKLKIAGAPTGLESLRHFVPQDDARDNIEFLGFVKDEELAELYQQAKAFLALAQDEDFGITPVEAMSMGTPVIAFRGGGYKETVVDGKTGVFFDEYNVDSLIKAIKQLDNITASNAAHAINPADCIKQAEKFSKERFKKEIAKFVNNCYHKVV